MKGMRKEGSGIKKNMEKIEREREREEERGSGDEEYTKRISRIT